MVINIAPSFPALVAVGTTLLACTRREFMQYKCAGIRNGNLLIKGASKTEMQISLIIDSHGRLWQFERLNTHRAFWRWLAPVIDLTLTEYRLEPSRHLTMDELLLHIEPLKSPPGFPTAGHLKGFLRKRSGQVFDEAMFKEFWQAHGFELKPPDFWGEVLELK
jgi:hypothetical protein